MNRHAFLSGYQAQAVSPNNAFLAGYMCKSAAKEPFFQPTKGSKNLVDTSKYTDTDYGEDFHTFANKQLQQSLPNRMAQDRGKRKFVSAGVGGTVGAGLGGLLGGTGGAAIGGLLGAVAAWLAETFFDGEMDSAYKYVTDLWNKGEFQKKMPELITQAEKAGVDTAQAKAAMQKVPQKQAAPQKPAALQKPAAPQKPAPAQAPATPSPVQKAVPAPETSQDKLTIPSENKQSAPRSALGRIPKLQALLKKGGGLARPAKQIIGPDRSVVGPR